MLFRLSPRFTTDDNDWNFLTVAERPERLKQLITGIIGHAQIEQNGVESVLKGKGQTCSGSPESMIS